MFSIEEYIKMARECLAEADQTTDPLRRKSLIDAAKLYTQSALEQEGVTPSRPAPREPHSRPPVYEIELTW